MATKEKPENIAVSNRKARYNFTILESFEAGIELKGAEVKSLREHKASLSDSFARIDKGELYLYNMHINPYKFATHEVMEPLRRRKLLAHKSQIAKLLVHIGQKGGTLVPLSVYFKKGFAKVELGLAKGKRQYDKRDAIKDRQQKREVGRDFRGKTSV